MQVALFYHIYVKNFQEAESLYNAETIFPSPFTESYPNRYLAILNASQGDLTGESGIP